MLNWKKRYKLAAQGPSMISPEHEPHGLASPYDSIHQLGWNETEPVSKDEELEQAEDEHEKSRKEFNDSYEEFKSQLPKEHQSGFHDENGGWDEFETQMGKIHDMVENDPELKRTLGPPNGYSTYPTALGEDYLDKWTNSTLAQTKCPACIARVAGDYASRVYEGLADETAATFSGSERPFWQEKLTELESARDRDWDYDGKKYKSLFNAYKQQGYSDRDAHVALSEHPGVKKNDRERELNMSKAYSYAYKKSMDYIKMLMGEYNPKGSLCPLHSRLK